MSATKQCRICGVPAKYAYFGAVSCQACKVFFKRNADVRAVHSFFSFWVLNRTVSFRKSEHVNSIMDAKSLLTPVTRVHRVD